MSDFGGHIRKLADVPLEWIERLTTALDEAARRDPDFWSSEDAVKPNKFALFEGSTQHVVFQFPRSLSDHTAGSHVFDSWATWSPFVTLIIAHVNRFYGYANGRCVRIMLAKLCAGGVIGMHVDSNGAARVPHKIHVPLITDPRVEFWEENNSYFLDVGSAYEVNNRIRTAARIGRPMTACT